LSVGPAIFSFQDAVNPNLRTHPSGNFFVVGQLLLKSKIPRLFRIFIHQYSNTLPLQSEGIGFGWLCGGFVTQFERYDASLTLQQH
jgi:hypothetical protein